MRSNSLVARLAELEERMLRAGGGASSGDDPGAPIERERRLLRIYFAIGLACSGVAGAVALLVMLTLAAGPAHERWFNPDKQKSPLVLYDALPRPQVREAGVNLRNVEMLIPQSERGGARLLLEQLGADVVEAQKSDAFVAVLRNVPHSVSLSRGVRETADTWRITKGDLPHLYLSLSQDAPERFSMELDIGASRAALKPAAIVLVRMIDAPRMTRSAADPIATLSPAATVRSPTPAVAPDKGVRQLRSAETPTTARPRNARVAEPPAPAPKIAGIAPLPPPAPIRKEAGVAEFAKSEIVRPQGMSSLGGPGANSGHDAPDAKLFARQVWWRLPAAPAWSPFKEAGAR